MRITYNESDDPLSYGRWEGRVKKVLSGRPGRAALRELEDVLEAMPVKELIADELCDSQGRVCALGAWHAAKRGIAETRALALRMGDEPDSNEVSHALMPVLPITETLGWLIQDANDELSRWPNPKLTPAERHAFMLRWIRSKLAARPL